MNINEMAKNMTREDFLKQTVKEELCPSDFGLNNDKCSEFIECDDCMKDMIKDIQFKGEEYETTENPKDYYNWIFNIQDFKNKDIAIHCKSKEEAKILFGVLITNGITTWSDGDEIQNETYYNDYKNLTCYEFDSEYGDGIAVGDLDSYDEEDNFKVYEFSEIDFAQIYTKGSIDNVALNDTNNAECLKCIDNDTGNLALTIGSLYKIYDKDNCGYLVLDDNGIKSWYSDIRFKPCDNNIKEPIDKVNFDITKAKYITKEQLSKRGYKTGDVLYDGTSMAIVYGNKVLHINANDVEILDTRAFDKIIPIELIESDVYIQRALSRKISGITQYFNDIEDYFITIKERDTITTKIYQVEFTYDSASLKNFISDDNDIEIGDIVECQCSLSSSNYQYCRVKNIINEELDKNEIKLFRNCRKLSV